MNTASSHEFEYDYWYLGVIIFMIFRPRSTHIHDAGRSEISWLELIMNWRKMWVTPVLVIRPDVGQQGLPAWALYRLCAASGRRTVTGAPGEGTSDTGDCQSGPRSEHTGSEIAVSRVCVQWSVFMEYSLFMINQRCCTQSHDWNGAVVFKSWIFWEL